MVYKSPSNSPPPFRWEIFLWVHFFLPSKHRSESHIQVQLGTPSVESSLSQSLIPPLWVELIVVNFFLRRDDLILPAVWRFSRGCFPKMWKFQWFLLAHGDSKSSPKDRVANPFQMACPWLINRGGPSHLRTGMILQVGYCNMIFFFLTHSFQLPPGN